MSLRSILWQALVKHVLVLILFLVTNSAIQSAIALMLKSDTPGPFRLGLDFSPVIPPSATTCWMRFIADGGLCWAT